MALPHCPAKYGSRAIITARQAIRAGPQGAPPDCSPDLIRAVFDVTADLLARSSAGALPSARRVGQTP